MDMAVGTLQPQFRYRSPELQSQKKFKEESPSEVAVFKALDDFLDLGSSGQARSARLQQLGRSESSLFFKHLQELVRLGVVGTESLEVHGQTRQSFVETEYADPQLRNAPLQRSRLRSPLDLKG